MNDAADLLERYVEGIRRLSGADGASLYAPPPLSSLSAALLVHAGEGPPVVELTDLESAGRFAQKTDPAKAAPVDGAGFPALPSESAHGLLIPLPAVQAGLPLSQWWGDRDGTGSGPARRSTDSGTEVPEGAPGAWLGLRFADTARRDRALAAEPRPGGSAASPAEGWWAWLFGLGGALASQTSQVVAVVKDPLTGLPDRAGFQRVLAAEIAKARTRRRKLALLLINPDEFASVNEQFGRDAGDEALSDFSLRLRSVVRTSDALCRYGSAIFAAILVGSGDKAARAVAEKILVAVNESAFLGGALRLGASIGMVVHDPMQEEINPLALVRQADQALNAAKRLGGGRFVDWNLRMGAEEAGNFDRLSGIFTGNMAKDYRNMVLLWDVIDVVAGSPDFEGLVGKAVERLLETFKPDRVALFSRGPEGRLELLRGLTRAGGSDGGHAELTDLPLEDDERELLSRAVAGGEPRRERLSGEDGPRLAYAVPLCTADATLGCLFMVGREDGLALDTSDLIFFKALASQLAVALDRARLAELERRHRDQERRELRSELNDLRQALQQAKFIYRSPQMESLMLTVRRVAPTDATVLVTGESGTGKELMARTLHELSPRRGSPMVVVDCGAIATSLIESELFGHERGAYTGAQQRRIGRLAEADGSTVLLDEIGELPLEVQSRLLRFVQEKQVTTVGGSKQRRVDVRILVATNRNLAAEVEAGRFREDLFYRLNVVHLTVPPLRERPDDILFLARHFLELYSIQYHKKINGFTQEAEERLLAHAWSGNVRELQNRMMQGVILCDQDILDAGDLGLDVAEPAGAADSGIPPQRTERPFLVIGHPIEPIEPSAPRPTEAGAGGGGVQDLPSTNQVLWTRLREALGREVDAAMRRPSPGSYPLGRWMAEDLILLAQAAARGVARRAAAMVGLPETTFRRRLDKVAGRDGQPTLRSPGWQAVREVLGRLVRTARESGENLIAVTERTLLGEIVARLPGEVKTGAGLLGVTPPTFRRRVALLDTSARNPAAREAADG